MRRIICTSALALTLLAPAALADQAPKGSFQVAVVCFKSGEQVSGMNKICYYDCLGSTVAININAVGICPLSINH